MIPSSATFVPRCGHVQRFAAAEQANGAGGGDFGLLAGDAQVAGDALPGMIQDEAAEVDAALPVRETGSFEGGMRDHRTPLFRRGAGAAGLRPAALIHL